MKTRLSFLLVLFLAALNSTAQWVQQNSLPGSSRSRAAAFTIGTKIYVVGGYNVNGAVLNDFWEYDIPSNTWLQKTNFPGQARYGATTFVLNGRGYIATGANDFGYLDDLWEFNPATDSWAQRVGLPAGSAQHENQRREAFSFVIGNKAYLGGGDGFVFTPNSTFNYAFFDLWEYNPNGQVWTHKSDVPDFLGRNMSIGVSLFDKAFIGLGCDVDQTTNRTSFWEYDPVSDTWIAKADFPNNFTTDPSAFVLDSSIYVVGGVNLNPVSASNQVMKYDPQSDTWTQEANFSGGIVAGEIAVSTGSSAFVGTGFTSAFNTRTDLWEYTPLNTGLHAANATNMLKVFPNPTTDKLFFSSMNEEYMIEVLDATGKVQIMERNSPRFISVNHLNAGLYTINIICRNGNIGHEQFVKID